jgi:metal-sulfur cluster biosynthetic enzyme
MKLTKKLILSKLNEVLDPELGISIVDLGLIYDINIHSPPDRPDSPNLVITMTLTTAGCPLYDMIENEIKNKIIELGLKKKDINIKLTFDPPWSIDKMSKKGKKLLGFG